MATAVGYESVMIKAIWQNAPVDTERAWADLPTIEIIALALAALIFSGFCDV